MVRKQAPFHSMFTNIHDHRIMPTPTRSTSNATPGDPLVVRPSNCRDLGSQQPFEISLVSRNSLTMISNSIAGCIIIVTISRQ